jgi:DNA end-binding protein Ku
VSFTDRYDDALADLVRAKAEGRAIEAPAPAKAPQVVDLMEALRASAAGKAAAGKARTGAKAKAAGKGKAAAAAKSAPHKRAG